MTNKGWEGDQSLKLDSGKLPWYLFPWDAASKIVEVLAFGAKKYAPRGWEQGIEYSRVFAALQRHMIAWWNREDNDPETGLSHLAHAGCCILFLLAFSVRGQMDKDDRPNVQEVSAASGDWVEDMGFNKRVFVRSGLKDGEFVAFGAVYNRFGDRVRTIDE